MTSQSQIEKIVDLALEEDTGHGDITSEALIPSNMAGKAISKYDIPAKSPPGLIPFEHFIGNSSSVRCGLNVTEFNFSP